MDKGRIKAANIVKPSDTQDSINRNHSFSPTFFEDNSSRLPRNNYEYIQNNSVENITNQLNRATLNDRSQSRQLVNTPSLDRTKNTPFDSIKTTPVNLSVRSSLDSQKNMRVVTSSNGYSNFSQNSPLKQFNPQSRNEEINSSTIRSKASSRMQTNQITPIDELPTSSTNSLSSGSAYKNRSMTVESSNNPFSMDSNNLTNRPTNIRTQQTPVNNTQGRSFTNLQESNFSSPIGFGSIGEINRSASRAGTRPSYGMSRPISQMDHFVPRSSTRIGFNQEEDRNPNIDRVNSIKEKLLGRKISNPNTPSSPSIMQIHQQRQQEMLNKTPTLSAGSNMNQKISMSNSSFNTVSSINSRNNLKRLSSLGFHSNFTGPTIGSGSQGSGPSPSIHMEQSGRLSKAQAYRPNMVFPSRDIGNNSASHSYYEEADENGQKGTTFSLGEETIEAAEARVSRKIEDLEISKKSLQSINSTLEDQLKSQKIYISQLENKLKNHSSVHDMIYSGLELDKESERVVKNVMKEDLSFQKLVSTLENLIKDVNYTIEYKPGLGTAKVISAVDHNYKELGTNNSEIGALPTNPDLDQSSNGSENKSDLPPLSNPKSSSTNSEEPKPDNNSKSSEKIGLSEEKLSRSREIVAKLLIHALSDGAEQKTLPKNIITSRDLSAPHSPSNLKPSRMSYTQGLSKGTGLSTLQKKNSKQSMDTNSRKPGISNLMGPGKRINVPTGGPRSLSRSGTAANQLATRTKTSMGFSDTNIKSPESEAFVRSANIIEMLTELQELLS
ncbi:hypothetical protein BB559_006163 [Furculomyces boomerangus]|uniref:Uncharacterized protein n=1 Tax=Furculomyces boomerangus TaxID=61424 RepID=A0A2T9Y498_9FUNG|nr:hypothetical protein BB559_006163 [Furculomyces boomerangus]